MVAIFCKLYMNQRLFGLETYMFYVKGDIFLAIRSQQICDEMVLRTVLYFGNECFLSRFVQSPHSGQLLNNLGSQWLLFN